MDLLSTPFDGTTLRASAPGTWTAATSDPPIPSLWPAGGAPSEAGLDLSAPWGTSALSAPGFPAIRELPTL